MSIRKRSAFIIFSLVLLFPAAGLPFGKNKVVRETFDWVVLHSVHFDIHYPEGIQYVLINGNIVVSQGEYRKFLAGKVLRK